MYYLFGRRFVRLRYISLRATCFIHLRTCLQRSASYEISCAEVNDMNIQRGKRASVSVGIKIPRFLRKEKDAGQIQRYCLVKKLCLEKDFDKAICYVKKWLGEETVNTRSTILILNGLLHSLHEAERMEDVVTMKHMMDARNFTGDRSTYVVLIDVFGKIKNSPMVSELLKEMTSLGLVPHERSYVVAAELALEMNSFSEAFSYFSKIDGVYKERLDDFSAKFITKVGQMVQSDHILSIFNDFRVNRVRIGKKTLDTIRLYFESSPNDKWKTNLSKISSSGVCENCRRQLEVSKFEKQEEHLELYFKNLINLKLDFESRDENQVLKLMKYLKSYGPFHVIVDGLNVAMHSTHRLDLKRLCRLVECFANQGKQVLVVAANDLISPKNSKTVSVVEHQQAMMYLRKVSKVFLVKQNQSGIDDLFLISAALNSFRHHSDVQLVSNDRFMDHRFKMTPQTASDFNRWLHAHQVTIKPYDHAFEEPLTQIRPKYAFTVQSTHDSWHFPSIDDKLWLCVERN